jgi:hypothetical protein
MKMHAPIQVELKVRLSVGDNSAIATYAFPPGVYPTLKQMQAGVAKAIASTLTQFPEAKPMSKEDFVNEVLAEKTGHFQKYAVGGKWDKP